MSAIDVYKHEVLGIVECPSTYEIVAHNNSHRTIPLYRLGENAMNDDSFQGKKGDLLLGGGSGESSALRVSIPETIYFYTHDDWNQFEDIEELYKAYWTCNNAYVFCEGYKKLGWQPNIRIESWLVDQIIDFVLENYLSDYENFNDGSILEHLKYRNKICRLPTDEEKRMG